MPEGAHTLSGSDYTSPDVFERERDRIFAREWVACARAADLPGPGDFISVRVAGESLLLVRGVGGEARGFFNVCRHRGSQLCDRPSGRFPGRIACPYHGWAYGLDGSLKSARHMRGVAGFRPTDFPLWAAPVAEWEGFLFVNLDPAPVPFAVRFAPVLERFSSWSISRLVRAARSEYEVEANWKLIAANYSECYHCPIIHPALARLSPADSGANDLRTGRALGGWMELTQSAASMARRGDSVAEPLPGLSAEDRRRVYYYLLFPNLFLSLHPDYVMAHLLTPRSVDRTLVACEWYFEPEAAGRPGFDPSGAVEFWDLTNRQDWQACERSHQGLKSRAYTPGPYGDSEELLWAFDQQYRRSMDGS